MKAQHLDSHIGGKVAGGGGDNQSQIITHHYEHLYSIVVRYGRDRYVLLLCFKYLLCTVHFSILCVL